MAPPRLYVESEGTDPVSFTLDGYDVVNKMEYPPDEVEYDGLLISGSRTSHDLEFIEYTHHNLFSYSIIGIRGYRMDQ